MSDLSNARLCFIGGGKIASCLIAGSRGVGARAEKILVIEPDAGARKALGAVHPGLVTKADIGEAAALFNECDVAILCVKPDVARRACESLSPLLSADKKPRWLVSVAAGVTLASLNMWAGDTMPIVRCMPNTPAQIQLGMSALCANNYVDDAGRTFVENVFSAVGETVWIEDESQMDLITALSGSGPAYLFRVMESLEKAATALGLSPQLAHRLLTQTIIGGAHLAGGDTSLAQLRESVTSPNGVTERGLAELDDADIDNLFHRVLDEAQKRAHELSAETKK